MDDPFLIRLAERNLRRHMTGLAARLPGMTVLERAGCAVVDTGLPSDTLNTVSGAPRHLLTSDDIRWVLDHFRERRLPFTWWVGPSDLWAGDALCAHGLALSGIEMGMAGELRRLALPAAGPGVDVRRAGRLEDVMDHAGIVASAVTPPDETLLGFYERAADVLLLPDTDRHVFVLYERGVPQSTVELCVSQHIVGLYAVATRPVARGRGYAATVAAEALRFARHVVRARSVVLQSNPRARPLYERIGLHAIGEFHQFVPEVSEAEWAG